MRSPGQNGKTEQKASPLKIRVVTEETALEIFLREQESSGTQSPPLSGVEKPPPT